MKYTVKCRNTWYNLKQRNLLDAKTSILNHSSIGFETIIYQQHPILNNYAQSELLITTIIESLATLDTSMDAQY